MQLWYSLYILAFVVLVLFLYSLSAAYEKQNVHYPRVLSYSVCCFDSIVGFCILALFMTISIIVFQLLAYTELYNNNEICLPILYYFGNTNGCKQVVARQASIQVRLYEIQRIINQMEEYRKRHVNNIQDRYYPLKENFIGNQQSAISFFSNIIPWLQDMYFRTRTDLTIYFYKLYYEILLPFTIVR